MKEEEEEEDDEEDRNKIFFSVISLKAKVHHQCEVCTAASAGKMS